MNIFQMAARPSADRNEQLRLLIAGRKAAEKAVGMAYAAEALAIVEELYPTAVAAYFTAPAFSGTDEASAQIVAISDEAGTALFSLTSDHDDDLVTAEDCVAAALECGYAFRRIDASVQVLDIKPGSE